LQEIDREVVQRLTNMFVYAKRTKKMKQTLVEGNIIFIMHF